MGGHSLITARFKSCVVFLSKPARMKPLAPENQLSADLCTALNRLRDSGIFPAMFFHVPNEFKPTKNFFAAWAIKESIGCVSGAPDWVITWQGGTLLVELKAAKTQKAALNAMRDGQRDFAMLCDKYGIAYEVHISVQGVIDSLRQRGAFAVPPPVQKQS